MARIGESKQPKLPKESPRVAEHPTRANEPAVAEEAVSVPRWAPANGPGNGHAISHYLHELAGKHPSDAFLKAEADRAGWLGQLTYPSGWAEGANHNGLAIALRHGLSYDEVRCIQHWTSQRVCDDVNPCLRNDQPVPEEFRWEVETLCAGLARLPGYRGHTYRGTALPESVVAELERTGEFVDKGVVATSKRKEDAAMFIPRAKEGFVPVLLSFDSEQGRDISLVGWHHELREVEFLPGARFQLVSMERSENGHVLIHLKDAPAASPESP